MTGSDQEVKLLGLENLQKLITLNEETSTQFLFIIIWPLLLFFGLLIPIQSSIMSIDYRLTIVLTYITRYHGYHAACMSRRYINHVRKNVQKYQQT